MIVIAHPGNMTLSFNNKEFEDIIFYLCPASAAACCGSVYCNSDINYPITIQILYCHWSPQEEELQFW